MRTVTEALAFLESQPNVGKYLADRGIMGVRGDPKRCPVARYLQAEGFPDVTVGLLSVHLNGANYPLPRKVGKFIDRYDEAGVAVVQQLYGFQAVL